MKRYILLIVPLVALLGACSTTGVEPYITATHKFIKTKTPQKAEKVREIAEAENYDALCCVIKDSICIFYTVTHPKGFFSILDIKNNADLGTFCTKGRGPNETINMMPFFETYTKDGDMMALLVDGSNDRMYEWNITRSIASGRTEYDAVKQFETTDRTAPVGKYNFRINDDKYFATTSPVVFTELHQAVSPRISIRSLRDNSKIREYPIFSDSLIKLDEIGKWSMHEFFTSEYAIRPDLNKVVMVMGFFPQVNIIDLNSAKMEAFRIKEAEKVSMNKSIWQYASVCCNDKHIYALYQNRDLLEANSDLESYKKHISNIHVFDWNGNMVANMELDEYYNSIYLDGEHLYAFRHISGKLAEYRIDNQDSLSEHD